MSELDELFNLDVTRQGPAMVVRMVGSAGMEQLDLIHDEFQSVASTDINRVVIDLSQLQFITSGALGQLITLRKGVGAHGGSVILVNPSPCVRNVLETTQLTKLFTICQSVSEAVDSQ